ncbi:hypothetical protein Cni_G26705 [Canna indica]|uniref:Uncharacterized protein n=1 Tax=Canna indica TaxID=4628 RepID=A0AAQ3L6P7_9LILI|nr:hypothetical protein Cni_G26705 [Canna indica]
MSIHEEVEVVMTLSYEVPENKGQCIPTSFTASSNSFLQFEVANEMSSSSSEKPKIGHDDDIDVEKPCENSTRLSLERTSQNTRNMTVKFVQEVCSETTLVAYKLIGSMLDKLLITEGIYAYYSTRSYSNGGSSNPPGLQGPGIK